ncbi:tetratricopeptide repeat protein [Paraburkholderia bannensis]|uniref:tetratricopeptide repeat protein n=1 Tax=Paraburkholderia bannensis TaxID=765414 RepID=UPI002AAFAB4D|nr:tetratricopeptide repeat protein [Paraburkholderia bannensis]
MTTQAAPHLYQSALALFSGGRPADAFATLAPLLGPQSADASALNLAALCLATTGNKPAAAALWQRAIAAKPDSAYAHRNLGNVLYELGHHAAATAALRHAVALEPHAPVVHHDLARVLQKSGHPVEAEHEYRQALALHATGASLHNDLGALLNAAGRHAEAEAACREAIRLQPAFAQAHNNLGAALLELGRLGDAEASLHHALTLQPDYATALYNLGAAYFRQRLLAQAVHAWRRAIALQPDYANACTALGLALTELDRHEEAEVLCRHAVAIQPDRSTLNNLGLVLYERQKLAEATSCFRRALTLEPDSAQVKLNLALSLLADGNFAHGWPLWESRYDEGLANRQTVPPELPFPQWQGESLAGKSLIVWHEQGYGDSFQFSRYLPLLKASGVAYLSVACLGTAKRLFETIEGVDEWIALDGTQPIGWHDYWCFTMSLPLRFGTTVATIPANVPYLRATQKDVERWKARLPAGGLTVGLVWAGDPRPDHADSRVSAADRRRSMTASAYLPLLNVPGIAFVSLQKGATTQAQIDDLPPALRPLDLMNDVRDFADTAAIIENLDLVITVDTSIAHLAGALGKTVWMLSRFDGCWRWLRERDDTLWYPQARLFRQTRPGDWDEVIARVALELRTLSPSRS